MKKEHQCCTDRKQGDRIDSTVYVRKKLYVNVIHARFYIDFFVKHESYVIVRRCLNWSHNKGIKYYKIILKDKTMFILHYFTDNVLYARVKEP